MGKLAHMLSCFGRLNPCKSKEEKKGILAQKRQLQSDEKVKLLLECERKAKEITDKARERQKNCKTRAKTAAENELIKFKKQQEEKFRAFCNNDVKEIEKIKIEVEEETNKKVLKLKEQVNANRDKAIQMLMDRLLQIDPKLHRNCNFSSMDPVKLKCEANRNLKHSGRIKSDIFEKSLKLDLTQRSTRD